MSGFVDAKQSRNDGNLNANQIGRIVPHRVWVTQQRAALYNLSL